MSRHLLFFVFSVLLFSCRSSTLEPEGIFVVGEKNLTISPIQYDAFRRVHRLEGPVNLKLSFGTWSIQATIPSGDTSFTFHSIPDQACILQATKEGYYPFESGHLAYVPLFEIPAASARIDSIQCIPEWFNIKIRLFTHDTVPAGGSRSAMIFVGLHPNVSPDPTTNFVNIFANQWSGNVAVGYWEYWPTFPASGTQTYITARLMSGATKFFDTDSSLYGPRVYTNLEQNTTVVFPYKVP